MSRMSPVDNGRLGDEGWLEGGSTALVLRRRKSER